MNSIRRWLYKPKKTDQSLLAQFFYADEDLNAVAAELDSFDGRKDPDRCTALVNHLRQCQDKVLSICQMIMDEVIPDERAPRDFRAKFPDDVLQENLAGQLWFGAECLSAGSNILNRELESASMRPLAKALTKSLENVRNLLREQCFRSPPEFTEKIVESLKILDRLFAEFELSYVSAMVPVKSVHEYEAQQAITVLFSETLQRALKLGLLSQEQVDSCDPGLMFTIPRLAIVAGLLIFPSGPLCLDHGDLSEMFYPFRSLLLKIRELLWTLDRSELGALERALCSVEETFTEPRHFSVDEDEDEDEEEVKDEEQVLNNRNSRNSQILPYPQDFTPSSSSPTPTPIAAHAIQDYLDQFCKDFPQCKDLIKDLCHTTNMNNNNNHPPPEPAGRPTICAKDEEGEPDATSYCCDVDVADNNNESNNRQYSNSIDDNHKDNFKPLAASSPSSSTSSSSSSSKPTSFFYKLQTEITNNHNQLSEEWDHVVSGVDVDEDEEYCDHDKADRLKGKSSASKDSGLSSMAESTEVHHHHSTAEIGVDAVKEEEINNRYQEEEENCLLQFRTPSENIDKEENASKCGELSSMTYTSECQDDMEIALAMQAAEIASRNEVRARFKNSSDLIHRLFICVSGVADQLQTNYAADLRSTLKCVFAINATPSDIEYEGNGSLDEDENGSGLDVTPEPSLNEEQTTNNAHALEQEHNNNSSSGEHSSSVGGVSPPTWVPDELAPQCMACSVSFTVVRRRHHCRNCGKVFCGRCSGNSVPLPRYGHRKPVRVCNRCFMYSVTPFTLPTTATSNSDSS